MNMRRKIIEIDEAKCSGCGLCVAACAEGAIEITGGKARIVKEIYCDGLGACIGECPEGALALVEREAAAFDEAAVKAGPKSRKEVEPAGEKTLPSGCPSTRIEVFAPPSQAQASRPGQNRVLPCHWPVQIRLVPPQAPFLKGASLLVSADCAPVACPGFHTDFLKGRVVLLGCPKFDDGDAYTAKFRDIFLSAGIRDVTVPHHGCPLLQPSSSHRKAGIGAIRAKRARGSGGGELTGGDREAHAPRRVSGGAASLRRIFAVPLRPVTYRRT